MSEIPNIPPNTPSPDPASAGGTPKRQRPLGKELLYLGVGLADLAAEKLSEIQADLIDRGARRTGKVSAAAKEFRDDLHKRAAKVEKQARDTAEGACEAAADGLHRTADRVRKPPTV